MKLSVSNLAWPMAYEDRIIPLLKEKGVKGMEIVPFKIWGDLARTRIEDVRSYRKKMNGEGFTITALQGIFGPKTDFRLFDDDSRPRLMEYMKKTNELAAALDAKTIVFGAPGVRDTTGKDPDECRKTAVSFFHEAGEHAIARGVSICIEPNAREYHCNFITNAAEASSLVKEVGSDGFRLHLDAACMTLEGDTADAIRKNMDILSHFHVSEPHLGTFSAPSQTHAAFARTLKEESYDGWVSIEMLETAHPDESVSEAVAFAQKTYA